MFQRLKGSDRQCIVVDLRMKYFGNFFYESFETYETSSRCIFVCKSANLIFKIIIDWLFLREDLKDRVKKTIREGRLKM